MMLKRMSYVELLSMDTEDMREVIIAQQALLCDLAALVWDNALVDKGDDPVVDCIGKYLRPFWKNDLPEFHMHKHMQAAWECADCGNKGRVTVPNPYTGDMDGEYIETCPVCGDPNDIEVGRDE